MNKKTIFIISTIFNVIGFICIFIFIDDLFVKMILMSVLLISYVFFYLMDIYYQKEIDQLINNISEFISKDDDENQIEYEETIESKLFYQINELKKIQRIAYEEINETKQSLQSLITHISHQAKTPISNLKIYQSLLSRDDLKDEEKKLFLSMMLQQIDKFNFLIESLIKMSRLENDIIKLDIKVHNLSETVVKALNDLFFLIEKKNIDIHFKKEQDVYALYDEKWTREAIYNVLDNCIKYSHENTTISITVSNNIFFAKVIISDQGKGIKKENYNNIFKRFYREDDVHDNEGIGIGLFLTREILTKEEGYITVNSIYGKGSTFTIYLKK